MLMIKKRNSVLSLLIVVGAIVSVATSLFTNQTNAVSTINTTTFKEIQVYAASTNQPKPGVSYEAVTGKYLSLDQYPVGEKEVIDGVATRISTWPRNSNRCIGTHAGTAKTKSDGVGGTFSYGDYTTLPFPMDFSAKLSGKMYHYGSNDHTQNGCTMVSVSQGTNNYEITSELRPLFDFDGSERPSFFTAASTGGLSSTDVVDDGSGTHINPKAYMGWATKIDGNPSGFNSVVQATFPNAIQLAAGYRGEFTTACPDKSAGANYNGIGSIWTTDARFTTASGNASDVTKLFDLGGVSSVVWPKHCKDSTDYFQTLYTRRGYSTQEVNSIKTKLTVTGGMSTKTWYAGTTLFRQNFSLTADDIKKINTYQNAATETQKAGLYIHMAVDDYFTLYINGHYVASSGQAAKPLNLLRIPASYLKEGKNLIAIELQDKIVSDKAMGSIGIGTRWVLGLYGPETVPEAKRVFYGSWGEYSLFAPRAISLFASASGLSGGRDTSSQSSWSSLTHANSGPATCKFGCYTNVENMGYIPDVIGYLTSTSRPPKGVAVETNTSSDIITVDESLGKGVHYYPNATVQIVGNISSNYSANTINNIEQKVIIAKNITIAASVTNVDAWLIAKSSTGSDANGTITTCVGSGDTCKDRQLRVNGAVMANHIQLKREYTDENNLDNPAEIFNLRGDAYLWARSIIDQTENNISTVGITELPPRY